VIASAYFDPILGVDIHWEMVPMPAPTPMPIPNPFTGIVFDPVGMVVGLALHNLMGAVAGAPFQGPVIYWGAFPANTTGTQGKHIPGHILIPPGTAWAPVPKTPKPVIKPGDVVKPPKPIAPEDDAIMITGSKTVHVSGTNAVRLGDLAMSCSEPVRLPSSVVLAVGGGAPILIGGPPTLDLMAAVLASLRTRFIGDSLQALLSRMNPGRLRTFLMRAACFLTGHPVDVATGKVLTDAVDAELPGPLPLKVERVYLSACASRSGPLGHGWSSTLDQAVWLEPGKVVYLAGDGREIEFDTFDLPDHRMRPGDEVWHPIDRLTLRCEGEGRWRITTHDGERYDFAPAPGGGDLRARLQRIASRDGAHEIAFGYGARGHLEWVRDSGGRVLKVECDDQGRFTALLLPDPADRGAWVPHRRYRYDEQGDLVEVVDSEGKSWRFEYVTHLLVRETDRAGLGFYFQYDGLGEDAWCIRTWGDGGIYDHVLAYDKKNKVTFVTNSRGRTTQYHMNLAGLVTKVIDPGGGETKYAYDPRTLQRTAEIDPAGRVTRAEYDARGNCVKAVAPDETSMTLELDERDLPVRIVDANGGVWTQRYDAEGHLVEKTTPDGASTTMEWENGLLVAKVAPGGRRAEVRYDRQKNVVEVRAPSGASVRTEYDRRGRPIAYRDAGGALTRATYDGEGRTLEIHTATGGRLEQAFDAEGHLVEAKDPTRHVRLRRAGFHQVVAREEAGAELRFERDTEGAITAVVNELGERTEYRLDAAGRMVEEKGFDGAVKKFLRDKAGWVKEILGAAGQSTKVTYDRGGRLAEVKHGDGTGHALEYRADGKLVRARNESGEVRLERDPMGRIVREQVGGAEVTSRYALTGEREGMETSLGARAVTFRDALGDVEKLQVGGASTWQAMEIGFARDAVGREIARVLPGGVQIAWRLDVAGRPLERQERLLGPDGGTRELRERRFTWRGEDQLAEIDGDTLVHDDRGRLVEVRKPSGESQERAFDQAGNVSRGGAAWRYGPGGRLEEANGARYRHDPDGQLVAKEDAGGRRWHYAWNGAGLLREVERPDGARVRFEYDAFARRTRKQVVRVAVDGAETVERDVRFVWDGNTLVHEVAGEDVTTWHWTPETQSPIAKERAGKRWTIAGDQLGTPTEMYDELGELAWQMQLDLFGVPRKTEEKEPCPWRWPGQYEDEETGLYYNRNRYYDPETGQYLSKDPIGIEGGAALYAYVDDPTTKADPFGLAPVDFASLLHEAQNTLDFGTPRDGAVFWSGPRMSDAQAWARNNPGHFTLEQTPGGQYLDSLQLFDASSGLTPQEAAEIWDAASARFAAEASGEASVFSTGAKRMNAWGVLRTWWRVEQPALGTNPNVTGIVRRRKDGTPCA